MRLVKRTLVACLLAVSAFSHAKCDERLQYSLEDLYRFTGKHFTHFTENQILLEVPTDPDNLIPEVFDFALIYTGSSTDKSLHLDFKTFSPTAAATLRNLGFKGLCFDRLTELSLKTAEALPEVVELQLNELKTFDVETARVLANRCQTLHLNGLTELPVQVAEAFVGETEQVDHLPLDRGVEQPLLRELHLNGLRKLPVDLARALSRFDGSLYLNGVQTLSPEAASVFKSQSNHSKVVLVGDTVEFGAIKTITPDLARALVPAEIDPMSPELMATEFIFSGVTDECSEEVERILSKAQTVGLPNLRRVKTDELGLALAEKYFEPVPGLPSTAARHLSLRTDNGQGLGIGAELKVIDDAHVAFRFGAQSTEYGLESVEELSPFALQMILRHRHGDDRERTWAYPLNLTGLKNLPVSLAKEFSKFDELDLGLDGLEEIPDDLAEVLTEMRGGSISFERVRLLSETAEKTLAKCRFGIELPALESLKTSELALRLLATGQRAERKFVEFPAVTELSPEAARALALGSPAGLSFPALQEVSEAVAEELVKCEGLVWLSGAKSIPNKILAEKANRLDCIQTPVKLSTPEIKNLLATSLNPWFQLNRLKEIDETSVKLVMDTNPEELLFNGLTELPIELAKSMGAGEQRSISLNGLKEISVDAFRMLARKNRRLQLNGIETLSTELADQLWKCGRVDIFGISRLPPQVSKKLLEGYAPKDGEEPSTWVTRLGMFPSRISQEMEITPATLAGLEGIALARGQTFISKLESLTQSNASVLASHSFADFKSLKTIDTATVEVLVRGYRHAQFAGPLNLESITSITPETAAALAKYPGEVVLTGLATLTNDLAAALSQHRGKEHPGSATQRTATIRLSGTAAIGLTKLTPRVAWLICNAEGTLDLSNVVELTSQAVNELTQRRTYTQYPGDGTEFFIRFSDKKEFKFPQLVKYLGPGYEVLPNAFLKRAGYTDSVAGELAKKYHWLSVKDVYYRDRLRGLGNESLRELTLTITEPCDPKLGEIIRECPANLTLLIGKPRFITEALTDAIAERTKETTIRAPIDFEQSETILGVSGNFGIDANTEKTPVAGSDVKKLAALRPSMLDVSCRSLSAATAGTLAASTAKVLRIDAPEITPEAAQALASFTGSRIELNGIQRMSEKTASTFAEWGGQALGVTFYGADPLGRWSGGQGELELSKQAAENLSGFPGRLAVNVDQVEYLEPSTAVALSCLGSDSFQDIQLLHEITLEETGCTLAGLCQTIEKVTNVPVELDTAALEGNGIRPDVPLKFPKKEGAAIELLTRAFLAAESEAGQGYVLFTYRKNKDDGGALVVTATEPRFKADGIEASKQEEGAAELPAKPTYDSADPFDFFSPAK